MKKKKIISMFCVVAMLLSTVSFASATESYSQDQDGPSEHFIEVCDNFFDRSNGYRAISKSGDDITTEFWSMYEQAHKNGDYKLIWKAVRDDLSSISWDTSIETASVILLTKTAKRTEYVVRKITNHTPNMTFELEYTVSGTYQYYDGVGQVIDHSNAKLSIDYFEGGTMLSYDPFDISTAVAVAPDRKGIAFSANFWLHVHCYESLTPLQIRLWTEDCGPYLAIAVVDHIV